MIKSKYLENLIDALTILPGVGRKTAQRMAYSLLYDNVEKSLNVRTVECIQTMTHQ